MALRSYKGHIPKICINTYVDESAVLVGNIDIGHDSSIWPLVAARGDVNYIKIGERTNVQDGAILHVTRPTEGNENGYPLIIGDDVTIGHQAMLHGCQLGNRILVGMSAIIMDNVIVEDNVIIGGGSLVPPGKRLESGFLYVGSPVKQARPLTEEERAFLTVSAQNYVKLKNEYLEEY